MSEYIVLMNPFDLKEDEVENFLKRWKSVADYLSSQPGYIQTELHQGIQQTNKWFNYAKWKSVEDFQRAVSTDKFSELTKDFPGEGRPTLFSVKVKL